MSDRTLRIVGSGLLLVLAGLVLMLFNDGQTSGISNWNIFALCAFLLAPMAAFAIYIVDMKGYKGDRWFVLALLFPIPTFLAALGLPEKLAEPSTAVDEAKRPMIELEKAKTDVCPRCRGRLNRITGDCTQCRLD